GGSTGTRAPNLAEATGHTSGGVLGIALLPGAHSAFADARREGRRFDVSTLQRVALRVRRYCRADALGTGGVGDRIQPDTCGSARGRSAAKKCRGLRAGLR